MKRGFVGKLNEQDKEIIYPEESYIIQGAVFEVYRELGSGFLESVYQECLQKEFDRKNIPYVPQALLALKYKGEPLTQTFRADFVCYNKIILELKAVHQTTDEHRAQLTNYLKATGMRLGLLANFGHYPLATIERRVIKL